MASALKWAGIAGTALGLGYLLLRSAKAKEKYPFRLSFNILGKTTYGVPRNQMASAVKFIQDNSKFDIKTTVNRFSAVKPKKWEKKNCYFLYPPADLGKKVKKKIKPANTLMFLYETDDYTPICWAGGTWGGSNGIHGRPVCAIPYDVDWFTERFREWTYHGTQVIVHEFMNALVWSVTNETSGVIPSSEDCPDRYSLAKCYKWVLDHVDDSTYKELAEIVTG